MYASTNYSKNLNKFFNFFDKLECGRRLYEIIILI